MNGSASMVAQLQNRFGGATVSEQPTRDEFPTVWVSKDRVCEVLHYLKTEVDRSYAMLYDLTAIDERLRSNRPDQPDSDFTVVYHLLSFERNEDLRVKVGLKGESPSLPTITNIWPSANW